MTLRKAQGLKRKSQLAHIGKVWPPTQRSAFVGVCCHKQLDKSVVNYVASGTSYLTNKEASVARATALKLSKALAKKATARELIDRVRLLR